MAAKKCLSVHIRKVRATLLHALYHGNFALADPFARVVEALVGLVLSFRVANLTLQIAFLNLIELQ